MRRCPSYDTFTKCRFLPYMFYFHENCEILLLIDARYPFSFKMNAALNFYHILHRSFDKQMNIWFHFTTTRNKIHKATKLIWRDLPNCCSIACGIGKERNMNGS